MTFRVPTLVAVLIGVSACKPPPPAPEGLNESARYLVREFYSDDETFQAGIQGFFNWFEDEGKDLIDLELSLENSSAFTVGTLDATDLAGLPLDPEIVVDKTGQGDVIEARDPSAAAGVVSLAVMDCAVADAEDLIGRPDQDKVFCYDWDGYSRDYESDRTAYEGASDEGRYAPIRDAIDPYTDGFDFDEYADTLMFTNNEVDPSPVLGGLADIDGYNMELVFRHGTYDLGDGDDTEAFVVLTFIRAAAWGSAGQNALLQSYSAEINLAQADGTTLRMLTVWSQPKGGGIQPDDPIALNFAVKKSRDSSNRMSQICAGEIDVEEPCK